MSVIETTQELDWDEFYSRLGHLYYGIAAAGGNVDQERLDLLKKLVHRLWNRQAAVLPGFQGYMPAKVDSVLDWLHLNETDWEYCLTGFGYLMNRYRKALPDPVKYFIRSGAEEIGAIVGGENNPALSRLNEMLV